MSEEAGGEVEGEGELATSDWRGQEPETHRLTRKEKGMKQHAFFSETVCREDAPINSSTNKRVRIN